MYTIYAGPCSIEVPHQTFSNTVLAKSKKFRHFWITEHNAQC